MQKPLFTITIAVLISCLLSLWSVRHFGAAAPAAHETAYERVLRTGVLRCGYGLWEPSVMRDPNSGAFSGIIYDFVQEVGKSLNIKVEYTLEMPWDSIGTALQTGKIDAHCAGIWATPARGRVMAFSEPLFFAPTVAFARADDNRFDYNLDRINQPDVTVAVSDDDITRELYQHDFPQAKKTELAQLAPLQELLLYVATNKADVAFSAPPLLANFERGYPGKVKIVPAAKPLRIFPDTIAVNIDEDRLLHMLNTAIDQMLDSGVMDRLVVKYKAKYDVGFLIPVNRPYTWTDGQKKP